MGRCGVQLYSRSKPPRPPLGLGAMMPSGDAWTAQDVLNEFEAMGDELPGAGRLREVLLFLRKNLGLR